MTSVPLLHTRDGAAAALRALSIAVALCGFAAPAASAREPPQEPAARPDSQRVTLDEAVRRALRVSPGVVRGAGAVEAAEAAERAAAGSFLPSLSLNTDAALASTERFDPVTGTSESGSSDSYRAGISASMDVFTGGRRGAELRQARAETQAAGASLEAQRFDVALAVKQAFFQELRTGELARVGGERVRRAEEGRDAATRRLAVGSATLSDSLRAELELSDARQSLLQAESDRTAAAFELGRLVGAEGPVSATGDEAEPRPLALPDAELVALAVERSPSVRAAEAALRSREAAVGAARAQYLPNLQLSGGSDWFNADPGLDEGRVSWRVGLGLSYPLFDRFARQESVARARADAAAARAELPDARRTARAEVARLRAQLEVAERSIGLAGQSVRVAEEDLRVQSQRYDVGAATSLDLITSQVSLAEAEEALVSARYDYQIARAELEALVGKEL